MPFDEPSWWYAAEPRWQARALKPLASVYASMALRRMARTVSHQSSLPVICIGNFTAGGTGKTPLSLRAARHLRALGRKPVFLTRGYGGTIVGPHLVTPHDGAARTGDEPLLLARDGPVMIARDRAAGARAIETMPRETADVIVMDDGLQNPQLAKSLVIAVVDGTRGLGNGLVIPAGPLRAPLSRQIALADAIVVSRPMGRTAHGPILDQLRQSFHGPVLAAEIRPVAPLDWLTAAPVVAYCGIGAPRRFLDLLKGLGATVVQEVAFADHHPFSERDADRLLALAQRHGAQLVTTAKDHVRLTGHAGARASLREQSKVLAIEPLFEPRDEERFVALLRGALAKHA